MVPLLLRVTPSWAEKLQSQGSQFLFSMVFSVSTGKGSRCRLHPWGIRVAVSPVLIYVVVGPLPMIYKCSKRQLHVISTWKQSIQVVKKMVWEALLKSTIETFIHFANVC